ncbi:DUF4870 family protein [Massilia endophytica]|uniref:DUF4870 family protein n=1 Tax=Massilia endophytica TaxID=2899220 RepID=UPI001E3046A1|nr:hypothetical protein [Massilia endophytica]UGQ48399.1 hypothetical protein LSQ66_08005 [Massilia endophytica]
MAQELILDAQTDSAKNWAFWLYVAHAVSFFFSLGAFSIIPLLFNYSKRDGTRGTFIESHHSWMIRSFWWYVLWVVVGAALFVTFFGIPAAIVVWGVAWIWKAYRLIRGWVTLNQNQPI